MMKLEELKTQLLTIGYKILKLIMIRDTTLKKEAIIKFFLVGQLD